MVKERVDLTGMQKATEKIPFGRMHIDEAGFKGTLPFDPGHLGKQEVTDARAAKEIKAEEAALEAKSNAAIQEAIIKAKTAISKTVVADIEDLPEDHKQETLSALEKAISNPAQARTNSQFIPRGPGISEAKRLAEKLEEKLDRRLQDVTPAPSAEPAPKPAESSTAPASTNCVHCGWQVDRADACNPTVVDKQTFVASILGQLRFTKEYHLLGGKLAVTFRTLTVEENDMVLKQLTCDWNDGKISGPAHSVVEATKYQLALALDSVSLAAGRIVIPTLQEYKVNVPEKGTVLPVVVQWVEKKVLFNEPLRRIISKAYGHFVDTVSKLEAVAETPDFWQAIGESI